MIFFGNFYWRIGINRCRGRLYRNFLDCFCWRIDGQCNDDITIFVCCNTAEEPKRCKIICKVSAQTICNRTGICDNIFNLSCSVKCCLRLKSYLNLFNCRRKKLWIIRIAFLDNLFNLFFSNRFVFSFYLFSFLFLI